MIADSVKFRGHRCFKTEWAGFDTIKPINVIIGRNNSGKSHILDLAEALCTIVVRRIGWQFRCRGVLDKDSLMRHFPQNSSGSDLPGDLWAQHGSQLVGKEVTWETDEQGKATDVVISDPNGSLSQFGADVHAARIARLKEILSNAQHSFARKKFRRLLADRDIRTEPAKNELTLSREGAGATNIIRRYIVSTNSKLPREVIQTKLLAALNEVFGSDGKFSEIQVKTHDEEESGQPLESWEVFLGEPKKGLVALSRSGSGLKTVILVLLNLLVIPEIEQNPRSGYIFAFEELENNLHPALLRRLYQYIEAYAVREKATIFMTTHSSVALDFFGLSQSAQIIHVTHDGESAKAQTVSAHFDHLGVISELGAKPSDLLQANGIIWMEGPSDCIYLNRWIDLFSGGKIREGRDYQCAFYGGSLLARTQFASPESAEKELVNLFRVNPNIIVVCDGDRSYRGARVKDRVRRIRAEVMKIKGAHIWITNAREIENYIPGSVLAKALGCVALPDPTQYELFFPRKGHPDSSYVETKLNRKSLDKMELAILCVPHIDKDVMKTRFEWVHQMVEIVNRICAWNA